MAKEKKYNPVLEKARKDKFQARKKLKEERAARRTHRTARQPEQSKLDQEITELRQLQSNGKLSAHDKNILEQLLKEQQEIKSGKRRRVIIDSDVKRQREKDELAEGPAIPKDPKRSIYYDPVYNPLGVAPPGMPYREWSDDSDSEGSTAPSVADIPLPPGPLPPIPESVSQSTPPAMSPDPISQSEERSSAVRDDEPANARASTRGSAIAGPAQVTYSSAPIIRDLQKEVTRMVPAAVRKRNVKHIVEDISTEVAAEEPPVKRINAAPDVVLDEEYKNI